MNQSSQTNYLRLREERAATLSGSSHIRYAILCDPDRAELYVTVTAAEGGGNSNKELVAMSEIAKVLATLPANSTFPSKALRPCFKGGSNNNAGYWSAALVHAGLIAPAPDAKHQLIIIGDWKAWASEMLALDGEPVQFPPATGQKMETPPVIAASAGSTEKPSSKTRRKDRAAPVSKTPTVNAEAWPFTDGQTSEVPGDAAHS